MPTSSLVYVLYMIVVNYLTPMLSFIGLNLTASWSADFSFGTSFQVHLGLYFHYYLLFICAFFVIGSRKLKKLRGVKRIRYGTMGHTYRSTTVFTSEGLSETCNTDYPHVNSWLGTRSIIQTSWIKDFTHKGICCCDPVSPHMLLLNLVSSMAFTPESNPDKPQVHNRP